MEGSASQLHRIGTEWHSSGGKHLGALEYQTTSSGQVALKPLGQPM